MNEEDLRKMMDSAQDQLDTIKSHLGEVEAEAVEAKSSGDLPRIERSLAALEGLRHEDAQLGATLELSRQLLDQLGRTVAINPAIVYAEAVESRVSVAQMRRTNLAEGVPSDWHAEMASLIDAKSFYWSPTTIGVVLSSAAALPVETIVEPDLFPVRAGWWWLGRDNAQIIVGKGDKPRRVAAIAWLLRESGWVWLAGFSSDWPELGTHDLHTVWGCEVELGRTLNDLSLSAQSHTQIGDDPMEMFRLMRFLTAGLLFIRQRVLSTTPTVIGRGARKRVGKVTNESSLQIVHLRRAELLRGHITDRSESSFTCQWWVRGHWRQQPYKEGIRPKWIDPYIKGDSDAPMKAPTEKVFAVVR